MKTNYQCANCDKNLVFLNGSFYCFSCGVIYLLNRFADTYLCWQWCDNCGNKLGIVKRYDNLHLSYCKRCGTAYFHKEIELC